MNADVAGPAGEVFVPAEGSVLLDTIASNAILGTSLTAGSEPEPGVLLRLAGRINHTDERATHDYLISPPAALALAEELMSRLEALGLDE